MGMHIDSNIVELRQVPTRITYMLMTDSTGAVRDEYTGEDAKRVLYQYIQYLYTELPTKIDEDYHDMREIIDEHVEQVREAIRQNDHIEVYIG